MFKLVTFRVLLVIPQLLLLSFAIFAMTYLIPGSAATAILGEARSTPQEIARIEHELGLDRPMYESYANWVVNAAQGDLGNSLVSGRSITNSILQRLPATLSLVGGGFVVSVILGVSLGMFAGLRAGRLADRLVTTYTSMAQSIPQFWLGLMLMLVFVIALGWLPVIAYVPIDRDPIGWARGLVLPSLALGAGGSALIARQTRTAVAKALAATYSDALNAAGVPRLRLIGEFVLRNAMIPVLAAAGLTVGLLVGSSMVMERVYSFPGIGTLMLGSVVSKDIPVVQGGALVLCVLVVIVNLVIDILYRVLDPKARPQ